MEPPAPARFSLTSGCPQYSESFAVTMRPTMSVALLGVALFGGLYAWMMVFVAHLRFRRRYRGTLAYRAPGYPWFSLLGLLGLLSVLLATWWIPQMQVTLLAGLPWLAFISLCYLAWTRLQPKAEG